MSETHDYDVLIVGAGFAGVHQLLNIRKLGLTVKVLETGEDLAGTWLWNRYPGAEFFVHVLCFSILTPVQVPALTLQALSTNSPIRNFGEIGHILKNIQIGGKSRHTSNM